MMAYLAIVKINNISCIGLDLHDCGIKDLGRLYAEIRFRYKQARRCRLPLLLITWVSFKVTYVREHFNDLYQYIFHFTIILRLYWYDFLLNFIYISMISSFDSLLKYFENVDDIIALVTSILPVWSQKKTSKLWSR